MKAYCPVCRKVEETIKPPHDDKSIGDAFMQWSTAGGEVVMRIVVCGKCGVAYSPQPIRLES